MKKLTFLGLGHYPNFLRAPKRDFILTQQETILDNAVPFARVGVGVFGHSVDDGYLSLFKRGC